MRRPLPLAVAAAAAACAAGQQPDQLHLSLSGAPGEMVVEFVSHAAAGPNYVWWSTQPFSPETCANEAGGGSPIAGWAYGAGYLTAGDDLWSASMAPTAAAAWCAGNASCAGFTFESADPLCSGAACSVYFKTAASFVPAPGWQSYSRPGPPCMNASSTFFSYNNASVELVGVMHTALMTGLAPNTSYWYVVGNATGGYSPLKTFVNEPAPAARGLTFAVFADFGLSNDESLLALYADSAAAAFDFVILSGDMAYDLDNNQGEVGNEFMRALDPVVSTHPLQATVGNHESHLNFSSYRARFAGVGQYAGERSGSGSPYYYSLDIGAIHWIFFSTEVFWAAPGAVDSQINWMKADLARANANRAAVPFVAASAHKSWSMDTTYCNATACYSNGTWFDDILYEGGVDIFFFGHLHEYRRFVPNFGTRNLTDPGSMSPDGHTVTDPKYLVNICSGSPGNQEVQPSDCGGGTPDDPTYPTVTCSRNYGYGLLTVLNSTALQWDWKTTVPIAGSPVPDYSDSLTLVVHNPGPRPPLPR
jgi:acid phosphatase type 7